MSTIVVGAGPGMGSAIAEAVGRRHPPVGLVARDADRLAGQVERLADRGVCAEAFAADIADEDSLRAALQSARERLGPVAVAVFNASLYVPGTPSEVPVAEVAHGLRVGVLGALITLQECTPDLVAARGAFLVTGGGLGLDPWPDAVGLGLQKAAVRNLVQAARKELQPRGVTVATVTIRGTLTDDGPLSPDRIAPHYAELADPPPGHPAGDSWEIVVTPDSVDHRR